MISRGPLHAGNTVFYSTANSGYATFAAVSLLGVRKYVPEAKLYLISSGLSDYDRKLLDKHNIGYHEVDLSNLFTKTWNYPIDCFYLFYGPEFFLKQGFDYSIYIDGDILCRGDPLANIAQVKCVAGVESMPVKGLYTSIFGDDWHVIKKTWSLEESVAYRKRINAGVVYFNNNRMRQLNLLEKASDLFKISLSNGIPRKGDDSLFSLLQYVYLRESDIEVLPPRYNYVLQFHGSWRYPIEHLIFFHFSIDKPWKKRPYSHENIRSKVFNPYVREWRSTFRRTAPRIWATRGKVVGILATIFDNLAMKALRVWNDQKLKKRGLKKSLSIRRQNTRKEALKVFWWRSEKIDMKNFGDETTADILYRIFGYRSKLTDINSCDLISTGSILEIAKAHRKGNLIDVWGSGFIKDGGNSGLEGMSFYAVRGMMTYRRVADYAGPGVVLGDPGLLASLVYEKSSYRTSKIGVVIHYADREVLVVERIRDDPRFMIINPLDSPDIVAKKITSCRFILSSSLHGLIFADSYGIPNKHIKLSDNLSGLTYKFEDYYSAIGRQYEAIILSKLFDDNYLSKLIYSYEPVKNLEALQKGLVDSFPY